MAIVSYFCKRSIVALTASAFEEERAEILDVGCDDFLRKPFREEILLGAIGKHLNLSYLYEDPLLENFSATNETKTQKNGNEQLTSESLSIMSLDWLEKLLNAAEQVDNKQLFELIEQIPSEYASTANNLSDLVRNFRCDKIIDLFEKAR
jgi:DNA-binding response OmpR family regulator